MNGHENFLPIGSPVVVRSYVSGVMVGRLVGGESGTVVLERWRWLRRWEGVGGEGSVYDLVAHGGSGVTRAGPATEARTILQQADVLAIGEDVYAQLMGGP